MTALSVFRFQDLLDEIDAASQQARTPATRASWGTLRDVVRELMGTSPSEQIDPTLDESPWWLTRAEILGFRGVTPEGLSIDFSPNPGITVIYGPNGSGKSSICDAVDVGLHQATNASIARTEGTGGSSPIWEPVLMHSAATGEVNISLALLNEDGRKLDIVTSIAQDHSCSSVVRMTSADGHTGEVQLGDAWRSAVTAYGPTYAYASWEQHIQRARDLQTYLARMLVLGGCFDLVDRAIDAKAAASEQAKKRLDEAGKATGRAISQVEAQHGRTSHLVLPGIGADADAWWRASGLHEPASNSGPSDTGVTLDRLIVERDHCASRLAELTGNTTIDTGLSDALRVLEQASSKAPSDACPVCGAESDWRTWLHAHVEGDRILLSKIASWADAYESLVDEAAKMFPKLLAASAADRQDQLVAAQKELQWLREDHRTSGVAAASTLDKAGALLGRLQSTPFLSQAAEAVDRASAESAWLNALSTSVRPLVEALRVDGDIATEYSQWSSAQTRLTDLETRLKKRREAALEKATGDTVVALLRDAGIEVRGLSVQKRQADLALSDPSGRRVELGMLSAGQRNAVLLAPALAVAEGGPFGFLLIDDPVHAFDELRVDFVARQIIRISEDRRVIVLTHDERLREHLLASPGDVDSRTIRRNASDGKIEIFEASPMWRTLLDDTANLLSLTTGPDLTSHMTNTLRGLCRQALDNALRLFVTREAVRDGADAAAWLSTIEADGVFTTSQRFAAATSLPIAAASLTRVQNSRAAIPAAVSRAWNAASHGNPPTTSFQTTELDCARHACEALLA